MNSSTSEGGFKHPVLRRLIKKFSIICLGKIVANSKNILANSTANKAEKSVFDGS